MGDNGYFSFVGEGLVGQYEMDFLNLKARELLKVSEDSIELSGEFTLSFSLILLAHRQLFLYKEDVSLFLTLYCDQRAYHQC